MNRSYSIIIPTLNEQGNLRPLVSRLSDVLETEFLSGRGELIFADGGSDDGTVERIKTLENRNDRHALDVRMIQCPGAGSLAEDVLHAARQVDSSYVVVMDADLSHPPEVVPDLLAAVREDGYDVSVGSRYVEGGDVPDWPIHRRVASSVATGLAGIFTDVRDPLSGFFAVSRKTLLDHASSARGFKLLFELLGSAPDLSCRECPITFRDRDRGASKFSWPEVRSFLAQLWSFTPLSSGFPSFRTILPALLLALVTDLGIYQFLRSRAWMEPVAQAGGFLAGALIVLAALRWSGNDERRPASAPGPVSTVSAFLLSAAFAVSGGSAVFALVREIVPDLQATAVVLRWMAGTPILAVVYRFCVSDPGNRGSRRHFVNLVSVGLVCFLLFERLCYAGVLQLIPEEAYYWSYGRHLAMGYLDHPPMVAWSIRGSTALFGSTEGAVRLPSLLFWILSAFYLYRLSSDLFGRSNGIRSVLTFLILPVIFGIQILMTPDASLLLAWAGMLYYAWDAFDRGNARSWLPAGFFLGIGLLSKYTILLLVPPILLLFLLTPDRRDHLLKPHPYLGMGIAFLLFLPVIVWNVRNGYASFVFQGPRRFLGPSEGFSTGRFLVSLFILITPSVVLAAASVLVSSIHSLLTVPYGEAVERRKRLFLVLVTLLPFSVFLLKSLQGPIKPNWTAPLWIGALPWVVRYVYPEDGSPGSWRRWIRASWQPTVIGVVLLYGAGLFFVWIGTPGIPAHKKHNAPVVWEQMADEVRSVADDLVERGFPEPIVVGANHYFVTSELAFYLHEEPNVGGVDGRDLFGHTSLMWEKWGPPVSPVGRPVILVSNEPDDIRLNGPEKYCRRVGEIQSKRIFLHGRPISTVYYRIGYDYQPCGDCPITKDFVTLDEFLRTLRSGEEFD